jgi:hypothetical protein
MKNADEFDEFLKTSFHKIDRNIADDGFTEKVLHNLPMVEHSLRRNLILYLACAIAGFIFVISSGYKSLLMSVMVIFSDGLHLNNHTYTAVVVITFFIGVSIFITRIEYEKNIA